MPSKRPREDAEEDDRKPAAKRIKKEAEDEAQSVTQDEPKVEATFKPWEDYSYSGSLYLLERMVKNIMTWLIWKEMPKEQ